MHRSLAIWLSLVLLLLVPLSGTPPSAALGREFSGLSVTADYLMTGVNGEFYAFGSAKAQRNPTGFTGCIVDVAVTADGRGALAVSSAGQFYAYGTAHAWNNPTNFSGSIVGVAITANGQGALAVSSAGQFYAYGNAHAWNNPTDFTGSIVDVAVTADGRGAAALSSSGQVYAYGSVQYRGNGDYGCERYGGSLVCLDIRAEYERLGGAKSFLGIPTSEEFSVPTGVASACTSRAARSTGPGPREPMPCAAGSWRSGRNCAGKRASSVSRPPGSSTLAGGRGTGTHFEHGSIYWTYVNDAHEVHGSILSTWKAAGWENGWLGFPLTDERPIVGGYAGRVNYFENGSISWRQSDGRTTTRFTPERMELEDRKIAARTLFDLPLAEFMAVERTRVGGAGGPDELDWTNNGCSGPTWGDVDTVFNIACVRHDFGWRNFGKKRLDHTDARKAVVDKTLHTDALQICTDRKNPTLWTGLRDDKNRKIYIGCRTAADRMYQAVRNWSWDRDRPKFWPLPL